MPQHAILSQLLHAALARFRRPVDLTPVGVSLVQCPPRGGVEHDISHVPPGGRLENKRRSSRAELRRHGSPSDNQEAAPDLVIEQAELMGREWAA